MTLRGKKALEDELAHLISKERPEVIKAISEARAHGDLKENAEYAAAKERQGFIEGRIAEINGKLALAEAIDPVSLKGSDRVMFGATVGLLDIENDEKVTYQIVGLDEAAPKKGLISVTSPISRALIGKRVGDEVRVQAPKGVLLYEIQEISYL